MSVYAKVLKFVSKHPLVEVVKWVDGICPRGRADGASRHAEVLKSVEMFVI